MGGIEVYEKLYEAIDTELSILTLASCFEAATADGSNTILLIPEVEIEINEKLENSIYKLASKGGYLGGGAKAKSSIEQVAPFSAVGHNGRNT